MSNCNTCFLIIEGVRIDCINSTVNNSDYDLELISSMAENTVIEEAIEQCYEVRLIIENIFEIGTLEIVQCGTDGRLTNIRFITSARPTFCAQF